MHTQAVCTSSLVLGPGNKAKPVQAVEQMDRALKSLARSGSSHI